MKAKNAVRTNNITKCQPVVVRSTPGDLVHDRDTIARTSGPVGSTWAIPSQIVSYPSWIGFHMTRAMLFES